MFRTLRIQLTDECNLCCIYCCHEGTKNEFSILKNKNIVKIIHACSDILDIKRVKFTGGEPLEYDENLINLIEKVNRLDVLYSIVTNATNYASLRRLVDDIPNIEITISLPVPPKTEYENDYGQITGGDSLAFRNVIESLNYLINKQVDFKVNYVLCKGINTSRNHINDMIDFASRYPKLQLRFLETAVNDTNNANNQMSNYIFTQQDFENVLRETRKFKKYEKTLDIRPYAIYKNNKQTVKLIKFFCHDECVKCPEEKTSLWLTSTGHLKDCSYRITSVPIQEWQQDKIADLLQTHFVHTDI